MSSLRQRLLHVDKRPRHDRRSEAPISPHLSLGGCLLLHVARAQNRQSERASATRFHSPCWTAPAMPLEVASFAASVSLSKA